ncbi:MAG: hypothetical protein U1E59_18365 [Amaricoccus sp.]
MSGKKISEFVTENPGAEADYSEDAYLHAVQSGADVWLRLLNLLDRTTRSLTKVAGYDADGRPGTADIADYDADEGDFFQADGSGGSIGRPPATATQALDTSNSNNPLTGASIVGLLDKGSAIICATTIVIPVDGVVHHVTGSTGPVTNIDYEDGRARPVFLVFDSTPQLNHNATSLILPTGGNLTMAAGNVALVLPEGGDNVRLAAIWKADGTPIAGSFSQYTAPTSTVAAIVAFLEATNNGTNKVSVSAPSALGGDRALTLRKATSTSASMTIEVRSTPGAAWPALTSMPKPGVLEDVDEQAEHPYLNRHERRRMADPAILLPRALGGRHRCARADLDAPHGLDQLFGHVGLPGSALDDDEALDAAWGTPVVVNDEGGTADRHYITLILGCGDDRGRDGRGPRLHSHLPRRRRQRHRDQRRPRGRCAPDQRQAPLYCHQHQGRLIHGRACDRPQHRQQPCRHPRPRRRLPRADRSRGGQPQGRPRLA